MKNQVYRFKNLSSSPLVLRDPKWQTDLVKKISEDFQDAAMECNMKFRSGLAEILSHTESEKGIACTGAAVQKLMRETPKLHYIKEYTDPSGDTYDIEIDLLERTVRFILLDR